MKAQTFRFSLRGVEILIELENISHKEVSKLFILSNTPIHCGVIISCRVISFKIISPL